MSIAIVGWWAAGLMCAATLLESGYSGDIFLFDKNPHLGAKVIISWGGRCNVTTSFYKKEVLKTKYPRGRDTIEPAITSFGPKKIYKWFSDHGVPLKIEKDGRVFPVSNNGKDVVGVFEKLFTRYNNLKLCLGEKIISITKNVWVFDHVDRVKPLDSADSVWFQGSARNDNRQYEGQWAFVIMSDKNQYLVDTIVLATGGNAYRHTGSSGDGYLLAQQLWHTITTLGPSLNSFESNCARMKELSWLAFPESQIISHTHTTFNGPLLLTHFGISGPMVFAYSAHVAFEACNQKNPLLIQRKPIWSRNNDDRMEFFTTQIKNNPKKQIDSILKQFFPIRFVQSLLYSLGIGSTWIINTLTKQHLKVISKELGEGIEIPLIARRAWDEFVTAGGIPAHEVDHLTLESTICPWLYFAWEILDVDGVTWWYNLTASRAGGYIVGQTLYKKLSPLL